MMPPWLLPGPFPAAFDTDERCTITELLNDPSEPGVSLAEARVAPGVTTRLHALDGITERYVILSGTGLAEIDGATEAVAAGDRIVIPPGVSQRISNTGADDLVFYCVCTPRFRPEAYADLDA